jgi:aspartate/methionine/tyrosine aminotransferase
MPLRPEIQALEQNGITKLALPRIDDPTVIPLWFGEGDTVTPTFVIDATTAALEQGDTFYRHTRGRGELREAIKTYLDRLYDIDVHPDRITVPGAAMLGITIASQMALSRGDHGLITSPNWPNIENSFNVTGAEVSFVRQRETAAGWQLGAADIIAAVRDNTRAIFVNSPCNPTGWVMSAEDQEQLLRFCRERDILLIADEVYPRTVFDTPAAPSFLALARDDDPVVVINGFSKAWAMTGWRIGWVVAPRQYATQWTVMSECFNTGSTVFTQPGAIAALSDGEEFVARLTAQYRGGRQRVVDAFANHPLIDLAPPEGAFYAFPKVQGLRDSWSWAAGLLEEENVGVAPGYTFGPDNDAHFRLCFAQSHERLEEGLARICRYAERNANL